MNQHHTSNAKRSRHRLISAVMAFGIVFTGLFTLGAPMASAMVAGPNTQYCSYMGNEPINGDCPAEFSNCTDGCGHRDPIFTSGGGGGGGGYTQTWQSRSRTYTDIEYTIFDEAPYSPCNGTVVIPSSLDSRISAEFANTPLRNYRVARTCIRDPRNDGPIRYAWRVTSDWTFEALI